MERIPFNSSAYSLDCAKELAHFVKYQFDHTGFARLDTLWRLAIAARAYDRIVRNVAIPNGLSEEL